MVAVGIVIMALILETYILSIINRRNAFKTTGVVVDQVSEIISDTEDVFLYGVVRNMPAYEGVSIYVADAASGDVLASSNSQYKGKALEETGIILNDAGQTLSHGISTVSTFRSYYSYKQVGGYIVCANYDTAAEFENYLSIMLLELVYLVFSASVIVFFIFRSIRADAARESQFDILKTLADAYFSMQIIDIQKDIFEQYTKNRYAEEFINEYSSAEKVIKAVFTKNTSGEDQERMLEFTDLSTLPERMEGKKNMSLDFRGPSKRWYRASFVVLKTDESGEILKVIFAVQDIDEDKKREESLLIKSNVDELTGCLNRRAFEEEMQSLEVTDEFAYVSIDVNGLKVINDTMGHAAGDELIIGAAKCMKRVMGKFGKIFRIGGDEFVIIMRIDFQTMNDLRQQFVAVTGQWAGKKIQSLSTSCGYVHSSEKKWPSMKALTKEADTRMYKSKSEYYQSQGVDRRGQRDAHTALCNMYTKILKVNLTDDTFVIVNVNEDELKAEKGYADTFSGWITGFGETGQIHPYNLAEYVEKMDLNYLREFFKSGNDLFSISYMRKIGEEYKRVLLEIIPTNDYSDDKQACFLYVKSLSSY